MQPKVSIVTVCRNCKEDLEKTIQSVLSLDYANLEYIIIDGASTDGTVELIEQYAEHITYWSSESDEGIYDAMNKGIKAATGQWVNFMNAGDFFVEQDVLKRISFASHNDAALIYGNTLRANGKVTYPYPLKALEFGHIMACHQSMFFSKTLLESDFNFNSKLIYNGDTELVTRIYLKEHPMRYIDLLVAGYKGDGVSSNFKFAAKVQKYQRMWHYWKLKGILRTLMVYFKFNKIEPIKESYSYSK